METALTGSGPRTVGQQIHSSSSERVHNIGELTHANDGRVFRYCLAGGTALVAGTLQQRQAEVTGDQNLTAVAAAVGDFQFVSTSTVTVDENEYANGWIMVTVTPGVGRQYQISGHLAYSAAAPTINLIDSIEIALTTDSRIDLVHNAYNDVIIYPASGGASGGPAGIAVHPIVSAEYGWLCVGGVAICLNEDGSTVGLLVTASETNDDGAVETVTHAEQAPVGVAMTGIANLEYGPIKVQLI